MTDNISEIELLRQYTWRALQVNHVSYLLILLPRFLRQSLLDLPGTRDGGAADCCEGCLVVRSGHGPQAEVAQGVGPGPLVEL